MMIGTPASWGCSASVYAYVLNGIPVCTPQISDSSPTRNATPARQSA